MFFTFWKWWFKPEIWQIVKLTVILGAILNFSKGPGWIPGDFQYAVGDSFLNIFRNFQFVMNFAQLSLIYTYYSWPNSRCTALQNAVLQSQNVSSYYCLLAFYSSTLDLELRLCQPERVRISYIYICLKRISNLSVAIKLCVVTVFINVIGPVQNTSIALHGTLEMHWNNAKRCGEVAELMQYLSWEERRSTRLKHIFLSGYWKLVLYYCLTWQLVDLVHLFKWINTCINIPWSSVAVKKSRKYTVSLYKTNIQLLSGYNKLKIV